jgi:hypothetical protein
MNYVHENCYDVINEDCSKRAHERLSLDWDKTNRCVAGSFNSTDWANQYTKNSIIDQEIEYWKTYGSGIYPALVINNRTYRG